MYKPLSKKEIRERLKKIKLSYNLAAEIVLLLQDIEDPINVGSIFRTADAFGVQKIILTGVTPTPPNSGISLTSRGLERVVKWEFEKEFKVAITKLRDLNFRIIGLELTKDSKGINKFEMNQMNICLVLGNEAHGIYKKNFELIDEFFHIPMFGKGPSLNVNVAGAIAISHIVLKNET